MATIKPVPGFDWRKVRWGAPNARRTTRCSYCGAPLNDDDDVPLMLWNAEGWCAEFCEACQCRWWGFDGA